MSRKYKEFKNQIGVNGKIKAYLVDDLTNEAKEVHVKDYYDYKKNLTPDSFLNDVIAALNGTSTDFEIKYISLSTAYDPPSKTTGLELEIARVVPSSDILVLNKKVIIEAQFGSSVTTQIKNITTSISTTQFTVNNTTGLSIGDRIACKVAGNTNFEERKISNIASTTITVHQAFSGLPVVGSNYCKQMISRLNLVYGASATSSLNSGKALSIATLKTTKVSTQTLYTRHEIELLST